MPPSSAGQSNAAVAGGLLPRLPATAPWFALPPRGGLTPARVALVLALVGAGLGARLLVQPVMGAHAAYLTVYPIILLCAVLWGRGAALLAGVTGMLGADVLFVPPVMQLHLDVPAAISFVVVVGSALFVKTVGERWRASEAATRASVAERRRTEDALRRREADLQEIAESLRRSNVRLLESEARYRLLNEATNDVIWEWDLVEGRLGWNDALSAAFGWSPREIPDGIGWWHEQIHAEDRGRVAGALQAVIDDPSQHAWSAEYRFRHRDGRWLEVLDRGVVARDEAGRGVRVVGSMIDLTGRRAAEERLRASERLFRSVFEQAAIGMARVRLADARWEDVNEAFCQMLGYRREEMLGRSWPEMTHPDDLEADLVPFGRLAQGELDSYTVEKRFLHRDGRHVWARLTLSLVRDGKGRPDFEIAIVEDVSERKRAEQALRDANAALVEVDQRRAAFLAVLSHELRNPLAPIRNGLYILDRAPPGGPQARRAHEVIGRQVTHLTRLIDDLLDVTRISRGKIRLQRERVDLCELIHRTAEDHRATFAAGGVHLEIEACDGPLLVDGDPTRLAQVVGNLLTNAAKFTSPGGRVTLSFASDGRVATIRVRDDGAGIPAALLARLFEPFVQADATLDRSKGGLGLGLALVKGLVELHGGGVEARSEGPGRGAEFTVSLPLARGEAAGPAAGDGRPLARAPRTLRVLVIEDNADAAESLKQALELHGHVVETAASGTEGIERARTFRPEVVLCDIGLPGIDGFEVARRMRADPALQGAPLVALSGYAAPEDLERSREAGFAQHLAKPPDLDALERTLAEVAGARRNGAAAPAVPG